MPNATAAKPKRANRSRHRIDWIAAKTTYVSDPRRSFGRIARQFGISEVAVRNHAGKNGWEETALDFDRQVEERALVRAVRTREARNALYLRATDLAFEQAVEKLVESSLDVKLSDLPALGKHAELLTGEATDRISIVEAQSMISEIVRLAGAFIDPGKRPAFLEALTQAISKRDDTEPEA